MLIWTKDNIVCLFLALSINLFALSQLETLSSSPLTVFSRDFKLVSAYSKFVSSAKTKNENSSKLTDNFRTD